jgi:acetylcholinesterase
MSCASLFLGAFQNGDTSLRPGDTVVARSITLDEPVVFVSANYRLNGTIFFGDDDEPSPLAVI